MMLAYFSGTWDPYYCTAGDPNDHNQASVSGPDDGAAHRGTAALTRSAGEAGGCGTLRVQAGPAGCGAGCYARLREEGVLKTVFL